MGWNDIKGGSKYFNDIDGEFVYYVHSYYVKSDLSEVLFSTEYDAVVPGIVRNDNVMGFQFHPEKSGEVGVKILEGIKEFVNDYISGN